MATIRELESKITLLEKGLKSKATKPALKVKMREQVSELKKKIKVLERASDRGLDDVAKAKRLAKKKRSEQARQSLKDKDIESDANRYAINKTKRRSQGGRANQFGTKAENKGGVYYESRENRYDRQNKRYAKLGDGGMFEKGGETRPSLELYKKELQQLKMQRANAITDIDKFRIDKKIREVSNIIEHREKMADGGMMAKGGEVVPYIIWVSKGDDKRELYGEYKSQRAAEMAMKKLWDNSDYVEMGNKPKSKYEKEGLYADGGTTDVGGTQFSTEDLSGMFANGGSIKNQYKGRSAEDIWDSWTISQRTHFLKDHYLPNLEKTLNNKQYKEVEEQIREVRYSNWDKLPTSVHMEVERHIFMGQYANGGETHRGEGGMYAKGGMTEHGLKIGDKILSAGTTLIIVENYDGLSRVSLNKGTREYLGKKQDVMQ